MFVLSYILRLEAVHEEDKVAGLMFLQWEV